MAGLLKDFALHVEIFWEMLAERIKMYTSSRFG